MEGWGWFLIIFVIIIIIIIVVFAFWHNTPAGNQATQAAPPTSNAIWWVLGIIFIFIIIGLIVWAMMPTRHALPVVVPAPAPQTQLVMAPSPDVHNHFGETYTSPPIVEQLPPPPPPTTINNHYYGAPRQAPIVAPIPAVAPIIAPVRAQYVGQYAAARTDGLPVTRQVQNVRGPASFDPNPQTRVVPTAGSTRQATVYHSDLGYVSGQLTQGPGYQVQTTDVGNHPVQVVGRGAGPFAAVPINM